VRIITTSIDIHTIDTLNCKQMLKYVFLVKINLKYVYNYEMIMVKECRARWRTCASWKWYDRIPYPVGYRDEHIVHATKFGWLKWPMQVV